MKKALIIFVYTLVSLIISAWVGFVIIGELTGRTIPICFWACEENVFKTIDYIILSIFILFCGLLGFKWAWDKK